MTRRRALSTVRLALTLVALAGALSLVARAQAPARRIAGFGSSVAFGTGDEYGKEGYTGMLRTLLAPKGWQVLNQSRGGDTTKLLATRWAPESTPDPKVRYLTTVDPSYAIIGLSLANEGIFEAQTTAEKDAVYRQFADGIQGFVAKARQQHITPVVTLCYPRSVYTSVEYTYIRRMNVLQNSWDVPTVNFLGAVDDGAGRWAKGFMFNDKHPNASGHRELLLTFVPTLFDALEKGKPTPSRMPSGRGFARVSAASAPFAFTPDSTMHPFAVSLMARTPGDGVVAAVTGSTLAAASGTKLSGVTGAPATVEFEETVLSPATPFAATVGVTRGKWSYTSSTGAIVMSTVPADGQWHHLVLSHYTARGESLFFVDGVLAGTAAERLEPGTFVVGGPGTAAGLKAPARADYRDLFIFRSALNADEVAVLHEGKMIQASLEVYAPLADAGFRTGAVVENRAQSLATLTIGSGSIVHVGEDQGKAQ